MLTPKHIIWHKWVWYSKDHDRVEGKIVLHAYACGKMHKMNVSLSKCMTFCFVWTIENIIQAWIEMKISMQFFFFILLKCIEVCSAQCWLCVCRFCLWENSLNSLDLSITQAKLQCKQWRMIVLVLWLQFKADVPCGFECDTFGSRHRRHHYHRYLLHISPS